VHNNIRDMKYQVIISISFLHLAPDSTTLKE